MGDSKFQAARRRMMVDENGMMMAEHEQAVWLWRVWLGAPTRQFRSVPNVPPTHTLQLLVYYCKL
jgi:hypothetical protein